MAAHVSSAASAEDDRVVINREESLFYSGSEF